MSITSLTKQLALLLCSVLFSGIAVAQSILPFEASYKVMEENEIVAHTTLSLTSENNAQWLFKSFSKPTSFLASMLGLTVTETSVLDQQDQYYRPLQYTYERTGKKKQVNLHFDWQAMEVSNVINGEPWKMTVPSGTYDKLSIQLALMKALDPDIETYTFPVADGGKLKTYIYKIVGKELLDTAIGRIQTIKINRNKVGRKDGDSTLWMAPDLNNLVVKMQKTEEEVVTLEITGVKQLSP